MVQSYWTQYMTCMVLGIMLGMIPMDFYGKAQAAGASAQEITGKDGAPMVLIPEGPFPMGVPKAARDGGVDERPNHEVFISTFYMDKYEVTNETSSFVSTRERSLPNHKTPAAFTR